MVSERRTLIVILSPRFVKEEGTVFRTMTPQRTKRAWAEGQDQAVFLAAPQ